MPVRSLIESATINRANYTDADVENVYIATGGLREVFFPVILLTNGTNLVSSLRYVLFELARILVRKMFEGVEAMFLKIEHKLCSHLSLIVTDHGGIGIDTQVINLYK